MKRKQIELSTVVKFDRLPVFDFEKDQVYYTQSFTAGETDWKIAWYPLGDKDADNGWCSIYLHQQNMRFKRVWFSFTMKLIDISGDFTFKKSGLRQFCGKIPNSGWSNFMKTDILGSEECSNSLIVTIRTMGLQRQKLFKEIIGSVERDIRLIIGDTSILANSAVLRCSSSVFRAMLSKDNTFIESKEKSIKLQGDSEEFFKDFLDFLHAGNSLELNIKQKNDLKKLEALIILGDKYQVQSLVDYLLLMLTDSPQPADIFYRLKVLSRLKQIPACCIAGKALMEWVELNMRKSELLNLTSKLLFNDK